MAVEVLNSDTHSLWAPYLESGESLRWTSRPSAAPALPIGNEVIGLAGAFAATGTGILLLTLGVRTTGASGEHQPLPSWFGWAFLLYGLMYGIVPVIWSSWRRWNTRYALTDTRALILERSLGILSLKSWKISALRAMELNLGWRRSLWFERSRGGIMSRSQGRNIGFDMIPDAEAVYRLILNIQRDAK